MYRLAPAIALIGSGCHIIASHSAERAADASGRFDLDAGGGDSRNDGDPTDGPSDDVPRADGPSDGHRPDVDPPAPPFEIA